MNARYALLGLAAVVIAGLIGRWTAPAPAPPPAPAADDRDHDHAEHAAADVEYVCPMHPQIRQDEFGTCPICFMDLVSVEPNPVDASGLSMPLSEAAAAAMEVRLATVERVPMTLSLDVFGRVATAEDGEVDVTAWTAGRIERLYVDAVGDEVRRGQPIARVYSPEVAVALRTMREAMRQVDAADDMPEGAARTARIRAADAAAEAARDELRLLGIDPDAALEDDDDTVTIRASASGTVLRRHVRTGDHVQRGTPMLSLVDLDAVWVQLDVYERDLAHVQIGQSVELRAAGVAEPIVGTIAFLDPVVDDARRAARARVQVENSDGSLRPGQLVEAVIEVPVVDRRDRPLPSIPASAVLWTGARSLVYVWDPVESPPVVMPVEVETGVESDGRVVVRSGVFPGETVVANGAMRVDAERQIRGLPSMMQGAFGPAGGADE